MDLFELSAQLDLDQANYEEGLKAAESKAKSFGDSFKDLMGKAEDSFKAIGKTGSDIFNKIKSLSDETAKAGDTVDKQSQVLGMSRKAYQEWGYILSQNGANIDNMSISMRTMTSALAEGSTSATDALKELGVSADELRSMGQEGAFEAIVRAFQKMPPGIQKSNLAFQLFGRSGTNLLPLLNNSADSIDVLRARAEELGILMSDDAVNASVEYTDSMDTLTRTFNSLKYTIGSKVMPVLTKGLQGLSSLVGHVHKRFKQFTIEWPSWDVVKFAAQKAWDKIREGALHLAGLVFGKKEDGSVAWPEWKDVKTAAKNAWDAIVKTAGNLTNEFGKLVFGTNEKGEVKWPEWKDVKIAAQNAWNAIIEKASALGEEFGKLVFGTTETGEVKWPEWKDVTDAAKKAWGAIVEKASALGEDFGKLVFGTTETGEVKWPEWKDVESAARNAWNAIRLQAIKIADWAGGLVFGRSADGSVRWPEWKDVTQAAGDAWAAIKREAVKIADWAGGLVFGRKEDGSVAWPEWTQALAASADEALGKIQEGVDTLGGIVFGYKKGENGAPVVNWPSLSQITTAVTEWWDGVKADATDALDWWIKAPNKPHATGQMIRNIVTGWWNGIVSGAESALRWALGIPALADPSGKDTVRQIQDWWDNTVTPLIKGTIDFSLGFLGLPDIDGIKNWIGELVVEVGKLFGVDLSFLNKQVNGGIQSDTEKVNQLAQFINSGEPGVLDIFKKMEMGGIFDDLRNYPELMSQLSEEQRDLLTGNTDRLPLWEDYVGIVEALKRGLPEGERAKLTGGDKASTVHKTGSGREAAGGGFGFGEGTAYNYDTADNRDTLSALRSFQFWSGGDKLQTPAARKHLTSLLDSPLWSALTGEQQDYINLLKKAENPMEYFKLPKEQREQVDDTAKVFGVLDGVIKTLNGAIENGTQTENNAATSVQGLGTAAENAADALNSIPSAGVDSSNAKGLNYVPYDGYIAELHRGEQVLTASQARHQNDGGANVGVLAGMVEDLKATLTSLRIQVGEKEFGSTVADYGSSRVRNRINGFNRKRRMGYGSI